MLYLHFVLTDDLTLVSENVCLSASMLFIYLRLLFSYSSTALCTCVHCPLLIRQIQTYCTLVFTEIRYLL